MGLKSSIEWTESTWNPVTGCTKVSSGCKNCYAERMAERLQAMGQANYVNGFELAVQPHMLELPLGWKKPQTIFVNSMSDLFHEDVPLSYIQKVFDVMRRAEWHRFQVLTKRSERLAELDTHLEWVTDIRNQCTKANVPFFFKQWGGTNKKKAGRLLEGRTWDQVPVPPLKKKNRRTSLKDESGREHHAA